MCTPRFFISTYSLFIFLRSMSVLRRAKLGGCSTLLYLPFLHSARLTRERGTDEVHLSAVGLVRLTVSPTVNLS